MIEEDLDSPGLDSALSFFQEDISFEFLSEADIAEWVGHTITDEEHNLGEISVIFCSDEYLLKINREHLDHDYYTDIITFQYTDDPISGDLFISVDRVRDNADQLKTSFQQELHRVIIHGILHLCGYKDKGQSEEKLMRQKEDFYLSKRRFV